MSLAPPLCTCARREHACSPPCAAHPERGGGLGNPGILDVEDGPGVLDLPGGPAPRTVPADPQDAADERAVQAEVQRRINAAKRMEEEEERPVVALEVDRRRRAQQERELLEALLQTD